MASPVVFNHIPKTAGTALTNAIVDAIRAKRVRIAVDEFSVGDDRESFSPTMRRLFVSEPEDLPAEIDVVGGHVTPGLTRRRYPDARDLTVLREARTRLLSGWLFSRAHTDKELRNFGSFGDLVRRARQPLADYLADPRVAAHTDNVMLRFLVWPHPLARPDAFIPPSAEAELLGAAREVIAGFSHVDVIESDRFLADLGAWLGAEVSFPTRNPTPPLPEGLRTDLTAEVKAAGELVDERTHLDHVLWREVVRRDGSDSDPDQVAHQTFTTTLGRYAERMYAPAPPSNPVRQTVGKLRRRVNHWRKTRR